METTWIVRKEGKETIIRKVKETKDLRILLIELGVRPSDIFFSEAIIFVEGESDRIVLPIWAEKMGINLRHPKVSIIPTWGKNRGKYYLNVWIDACKAIDIPYFMIFDKEAEEDKEIKDFEKRGILTRNENLFILKRGSIEDYYPFEKLIDAIESEYDIKLTEDEQEELRAPARARKIETLLKSKSIDYRSWKVRIGKRVAESMEFDEIEEELKVILERIRSKLQLMLNI